MPESNRILDVSYQSESARNLEVLSRGEQSSVITEITDQKSKPEPDRTEPNFSSYVLPHPNSN